ncbi:serine hydrolase-like protein [Lingula anatina]|uniref:Serine hydrolase-like protein n=1 Tax=Lingula anatina TaxID=7574 RepID=A0A2R2MIV5_LINAN|nr:serine hydrolase-like protein [Lingula anatina]|eukprot:XP_023930155.1 serine hydrolase-like protein [Lingula anatina]
MSRLLRSIYRYNFRHTMATSSTSGARKLQLTDEVRFPVPWGHIAAKVWGDPGGRPVLGLHGWQDNANSFDALAPLLPTDFYFIVLDFPGHGRSSHRPPGLPNQFVEYLFDIKRVVDVLKWKRFSIIGHSMGGGIGVTFAGLFPEFVERVVSLDLMAPVSRDPEMAPSLLRTSIEQTLGIEAVNKEEKTYTPEAALKRCDFEPPRA